MTRPQRPTISLPEPAIDGESWSTNDAFPVFKGTGRPGDTVSVEMDGETWGAPVNENGEWEVQIPELSDGSYDVSVYAVSPDGEVGEAQEFEFHLEASWDDRRRQRAAAQPGGAGGGAGQGEALTTGGGGGGGGAPPGGGSGGGSGGGQTPSVEKGNAP